MEKKRLLGILGAACLCVAQVCFAAGQQRPEPFDLCRPVLAVKTNALYWATTTCNLALEIGLGRRKTLDLAGTYNPWTFADNRKLRNWSVQPELRIWTCERFGGSFFGFHAHYAAYNAGGIGALGMGDRRYQGCLYGAGVSYGFLWLIGKRWNLELTLGVGYARLEYDRYVRQKCGRFLGKGHENYFGPTKVGISFGFVIK